MAGRLVTVFGGNGFVGRHIVQRLANQGDRVRIACRDPEAAIILKPLGNPGQILPVKANLANTAEVEAAVEGADVVINCVGLLASSGRNTFERIHVEGAANAAKAAKAAGAKSFVHISALGADADSPSEYAKTKAAGEKAVLEAFPEAVILRPSIIIGPEDGFLNMFAKLSRWSPIVPILGTPLLPKFAMEPGHDTHWHFPNFSFEAFGGTKFQPIFVGDVAQAAVNAIDNADTQGKVFELAGPRVLSSRRLMRIMLKVTQRNRILVPFPLPLASIAGFFAEFIPGKPLTHDQVKLLKSNNVLSGENPTIDALGVTPVDIESVLPGYLNTYKPPSGRRLRMREV